MATDPPLAIFRPAFPITTLVANGIRWRTGDNIVSADSEFPANVYAWQCLASRGVQPLGTFCRERGIFYCRRQVLDRREVSSIGHGSMVPREDYLPYKFALRADAARFEGGAQNIVGICGLGASIELLLQAGIRRIEAHILALHDRLVEALQQWGSHIYSPHARRAERSGVVSFASPQQPSSMVHQRLRQQGIVVTTRSGWVRVAPHLYHPEGDIDRLLAALP